MYKSIYASNTNTVLSEHDNSYKNISKLIYDRTKRFINSKEIDGWEGIDELRN